MRSRLLFAIILIVAAGRHAHAQRVDEEFGAGNAARWYAAAVDAFEVARQTTSGRLFEVELDAAEAYLREADAPPPTALRTLLARVDGSLGQLRRAASSPYCDFRTIDADGDVPPGRLAFIRSFATCLGVDAMVRLHDGDTAGAAATLFVLYRMADDVGAHRMVPSGMLAVDAFGVADRITAWAVDRALFGPAETSMLLGAFSRIDPHDPFHLVEGLEQKRAVTVPWFVDRYGGEGGVELARTELASVIEDPIARTALTMMSQSELDASLRAVQMVADEAMETLNVADPVRGRMEMRRIDAEIERGHHGPLAAAILPDFTAVYVALLGVSEAVTRRVALLDAITTGRLEPADAANAAVGYRDAIDRFDAISESRRTVIIDFATGNAPALTPELETALDEAAPIIEVVRAASSLERYENARRPRTAGLRPDHAGMRDLVHLLHADAVRHVRHGRFDAVVDLAGISFRVSSHLALDENLASSLLAHRIFDATQSLLAPGLRAADFSLEQRMGLLRTAREAGYRDPFGYGRAAAATRTALAAWILDRIGARDVGTELRVEAALRRCDEDQLFFLALCAEVDGDGEELTASSGEHLRHDDVFSVHARSHAIRHRATLLSILDAHDFDALAEPMAPRIGRIEERRAAARDELRGALLALRGPGDVQPFFVPTGDPDDGE